MSSEHINSKQIKKAIAYGCRLLAIREHSRQGIEQKMFAKGYLSSEITPAIDYLLENDYLSDARFCESFIRARTARGQGEKKIKFELKAQGLDDCLVNATINSMPINWQQNCDNICAKKLPMLTSGDNYQLKRKLSNFLTYRGFSALQIKQSIEKHMSTGVTSDDYEH